MMKMIRLTLVISVFVIKSSFGQFENTDVGARAIGLNGAFTSLADNSLAIFYNPAGLGQVRSREISVFYNPSLYGLSQLSAGAISYSEPVSIGTFGIGIKTFGFDLYRESNLILSYGNNFRNKIFYGLNVNYYNLKIQNYSSASSIGADIGAMAYLTDFMRWGFFVKNISGAKIGRSKEKIAQVYRTGISFTPRNDLNIIFEIEKDVKYPLSFRGGMEYFVNDYIDLRAGIGTEPVSFSGGISIRYDIFKIEYSVASYQNLGISNNGSLTIDLGGVKSKKLPKE